MSTCSYLVPKHGSVSDLETLHHSVAEAAWKEVHSIAHIQRKPTGITEKSQIRQDHHGDQNSRIARCTSENGIAAAFGIAAILRRSKAKS